MNKHFTIIVKGKVQGVFYRATARKKAEELNIKGFAQNLPDGNVLIEAEGGETALQEFIIWCRIGPPKSEVSEVTLDEKESRGYLSFTVK